MVMALNSRRRRRAGYVDPFATFVTLVHPLDQNNLADVDGLGNSAGTFDNSPTFNTTHTRFNRQTLQPTAGGNGMVNSSDHARLVSGDFTMEIDARFEASDLGGNAALVTVYDATTNNRSWMVYKTTSDTIVFVAFNPKTSGASVVAVFGPSAVTSGQWYRIAVTRSGNDHYVHIDGVVGTTVTDTDRPAVVSDLRLLFGAYTTGLYQLDGQLTQFRVTEGAARYDAANYTPEAGDLPGVKPIQNPANTVAPVLSGTETQGQTLSVTDGTWTGDDPITFVYQWLRGGAAISGATSSSYTLVLADVGAIVSCRVSGVNGGATVSAISNETGAIAAGAAAPVNTVAPAITSDDAGDYYTGRVLTTTNGTWTNSPTGYAYQWERDGVDIGGATSSSYTLVTADEGTAINCTVTATNAGGSTDQDSNSVSAVSAFVHVFSAAEEGYLLDFTDTSKLWQDTAATTPATTNADPVARVDDISGNGNNITQATTSKRFTVTVGAQNSISGDIVDDAFDFTVPTGGIDGTMIIATISGIWKYRSSLAAGAKSPHIRGDGTAEWGGEADLVGMLWVDRTLSANEKAAVIAEFVTLGAVEVISETEVASWWRNASDLGVIDIDEINAPSLTGTAVERTWNFFTGTSTIQTVGDVSVGAISSWFNWLTHATVTSIGAVSAASATSMVDFIQSAASAKSVGTMTLPATAYNATRMLKSCTNTALPFSDAGGMTDATDLCLNSNIEDVDSGVFDSVATSCTFVGAFKGCALTAASVDNIFNSLDTAGLTGSLTIDTSGGTSAAPTAASSTARTNLSGRGVTILTN